MESDTSSRVFDNLDVAGRVRLSQVSKGLREVGHQSCVPSADVFKVRMSGGCGLLLQAHANCCSRDAEFVKNVARIVHQAGNTVALGIYGVHMNQMMYFAQRLLHGDLNGPLRYQEGFYADDQALITFASHMNLTCKVDVMYHVQTVSAVLPNYLFEKHRHVAAMADDNDASVSASSLSLIPLASMQSRSIDISSVSGSPQEIAHALNHLRIVPRGLFDQVFLDYGADIDKADIRDGLEALGWHFTGYRRFEGQRGNFIIGWYSDTKVFKQRRMA